MASNKNLNPAEIASQKALREVFSHIEDKKSFIFEAGAGAGKTYSLVEALKYLIQQKGDELLKKGQKIACITYTNVAKDQILDRIDRHPIVLSETIHSFSWSLLKRFQSELRTHLHKIEKWRTSFDEIGGIGYRKIMYDLGYSKIENEKVWISHNDVISLMVSFMELPKFRKILTSLYPVLFIDEYQDTNKEFAESLKQNFIEARNDFIVGFFGDHWQKIYGSSACGKIESENLEVVEKQANFRSEKVIVGCLNKMRPELPQEIKDPLSRGSVLVFHTNEWVGERRKGGHWGGDMDSESANLVYSTTRNQLENMGWNFDPMKTKILMLTHNILAERQGYQSFKNVFSHNDAYVKKEDDYIKFFSDILEPMVVGFENKKYGEMFQALDMRTPKLKCHQEKISWAKDIDKLNTLRHTGTIGDVIEHLLATKRPRLPDKVEKNETNYQRIKNIPLEDLEESEEQLLNKLERLKAVQYSEMIALDNFIREKTPFSTKHGVKGEEYENVFIIFGRGWNQYNFGQFLELANTDIPAKKQDFYERNRNLFYVVCSRPIRRLALLFTQKLSSQAMQTLSSWFGCDSIRPAPLR